MTEVPLQRRGFLFKASAAVGGLIGDTGVYYLMKWVPADAGGSAT